VKKLVKTEVLEGYIGHYDLEKSLDVLITWIEQFQDVWEAKGYTNLRLEIDYDYDRESHLQLKGDREETDREYERRMNDNKKQRERRKVEKIADAKAEKELYEKLKKKYAKPV
jgi:hypothetical protein